MRAAMALRRDDLWARRVTRMVGVSTAAHVILFGGVALFGAWLATRRPPPIIAYSVELTDLPGTGGRLPGGAGNGLIGRSPVPPKPNAPPAPTMAPALPTPAPAPPTPVAAPPPPPSPPPAEAKPVPPPPPPPPVAKPAEVAPKPVAKVEPKKIEPKPAPKPAPKKVEAKPEPKPVEAVKKTEPKKVETPPPPKPAEPQATAKPAETPPAAKTPPPPVAATDAKPGASSAAAKTAAPTDDYASAAQRFRDRMAAAGTGAGVPGMGEAGGGPGGGVLGSGGDGRGGGQATSLEFLAYRERIASIVKERWSNAIKRPGLLTVVRFRIAPDGTISAIAIARSSGDVVYDQTAVAAVERVKQLPPPPPQYADEFAQSAVNFHGDETGGLN